MPRIDIAGTGIHYETTGTGPPTVCLVHGSAGSHAVWIRQMEDLADIARVIALDLPGHGASGGTDIGSIDAAANVVLGLLDALAIDRVVLGGHSMGGAVVQAFALAHSSRLAGLVLVGTGARLRVMPEIFAGLERDYQIGVRFLTGLALASNAPAELVSAIERQTLQTAPRAHLGDFRACDAFDVMDRVESIRTPTLIVCGEDDRLTPPKYARYLRDHIKGAQLALIPGAGHYVQIERGEETSAAIRKFLVSLRPTLTR